MADAGTRERKKLAIIDGKSVFYRGYYAMPNLATKDGTPTGGVFGFATMALEVIRRLKPDYVAVAWDKPKTNIRKRLELYPEYKAGRKPAPPDFYEQVPVLQELLKVLAGRCMSSTTMKPTTSWAPLHCRQQSRTSKLCL
jgi:DNA polymerase-1